MERIVRQIADLHNSGKKVVLVSSGAVGAGVGELGLTSKPRTIPERQAVAAVGQGFLMQVYNRYFWSTESLPPKSCSPGKIWAIAAVI